jgi:NAD(P)-dependent dehydrogenase (short-subunit alcohol dehydrogenase family)
MPSQPFVWVITGCSTGVGRAMAIAALKRGDKVIATTRAESFHKIKDLTSEGADILTLDVTASLDELKQIAAQAVAIYGHVDVVMNNAGFVLSGTYEETTHEDTLTQFNTNVFGALNVSRAFLPHMRPRRTGTIAFIGSCWGWIGVPFVGLYVASKFALRGISETLHQEIAPFGMQSLCFDSGCFRTPVLGKIQRQTAGISDYKEHGEAHDVMRRSFDGAQRGDPVRGVNAIIDIIKGEGLAAGKKIPIDGFAIGVDAYGTVKKSSEDVLERLEEWKEVTLSTDFPESSE